MELDASTIFQQARDLLDMLAATENMTIAINAVGIIIAGLLAFSYFVSISSSSTE